MTVAQNLTQSDSNSISPIPILQAIDLQLDYINDLDSTRHTAVKSLSLDVHRGEFLCVVGPSGCGKSSLISAIAGFLKPVSGKLLMNGQTITKPGMDRGVVFQEYALWPWLRVIDNVAFGLKMKGVGKAERHAVARQHLKMTNLSDAEQKYPHELSGGMKQRVAVARTLANSPDIMLMDEPFAAIDAQTRLNLQEELIRIWSTQSVTVVFVTHSVEEAVFLADRVVVLSSGPGRVISDLAVPISRDNRKWSDINNNLDFLRIKENIYGLIRQTSKVE